MPGSFPGDSGFDSHVRNQRGKVKGWIKKPCAKHTRYELECVDCMRMPTEELDSPRRMFARVYSIVQEIRYKPGYALDLVIPQNFPNGYSYGMECEFHLHVSVDDATKTPPEKIKLTLTVPFTLELVASLPEREIVRFIFNSVIQKWEDHEAKEWFKYRGELVDDPHAAERAERAREARLMFHPASFLV